MKGKGAELAMAHWNYVSSTLLAHNVDPKIINLARYHYTTAFVHGFKHGLEQIQSNKKDQDKPKGSFI